MADNRETKTQPPPIEDSGLTIKGLSQIVGFVVALAARAGAVTV